MELPSNLVIHPEFEDDKISELIEGALPKPPKTNQKLNTLKDYLKSAESPKQCVALPQTVGVNFVFNLRYFKYFLDSFSRV